MGILIDCVRIANFRAIKNLEVNLSPLAMLVGANNSGKTSFLRALHLALGYDRRIVTREDVHDDGTNDPHTTEIVVDVRIVSFDEKGKRKIEFDDDWSQSDDFSGKDKVKIDSDGYAFMAIRTKYKFDNLTQMFKPDVRILKEWLFFENWLAPNNEGNKISKLDSVPLIFVDAQRDIQADLKDRNSFLGKLTNKPDIKPADIEPIEKQINDLNEAIIKGSSNLKKLQDNLKNLNKTVFSSAKDGVEISPINKKIRDIGRNLNINFTDSGKQGFPLEYHGMGTRSWASLLTLNAFLSWQQEINKPYYPILALEEPEAHLHPNAQRQLYQQLVDIQGQKIISTHSPFVAAQCNLLEIRHFYKDVNGLKVGQVELSEPYEKRIGELNEELKISSTSGDNKKLLKAERDKLFELKKGKINFEEKRKIERNILNTRGESLFSKVLIFFEGETEEQALPILAKEKFGCHPFELGINFIGVGGKDNYKPFLTFAKFLNIKWLILSDGDNNTEIQVRKQIRDAIGKNDYTKLFVLDSFDFEEYLIEKGYGSCIIAAVNHVEKNADYLNFYIEKYNFEPKGVDENGVSIPRNYKNDIDGGVKRALKDIIQGEKTKYAPVIAREITKKKDENGKVVLPPKIDELFNKIAHDLRIDLP